MRKDSTQRREEAKMQKDSKNRSVEVKREVFPHGRLRNGSWYMLQQAKTVEEGGFYSILSSMLFSSFCMEAYLNYLGSKILDSWKHLERKLGPNEKLSLICEFLKLDLNKGERPFQTFGDMFKFRDYVVHAKAEHRENKPDEDIDLEDGWLPDGALPSKWVSQLNIENAQKYYDDARKMMEQLHVKAGLPMSDLIISERFSYDSTSYGSFDEPD